MFVRMTVGRINRLFQSVQKLVANGRVAKIIYNIENPCKWATLYRYKTSEPLLIELPSVLALENSATHIPTTDKRKPKEKKALYKSTLMFPKSVFTGFHLRLSRQ